MRSTSFKPVIFVVAVVAFGASVVSAQETGSSKANGLVAILDVAKVFKENASFGLSLIHI